MLNKVAFKAQRHPNLDACWAQNKRLIYWWARKCSRKFHISYRELIGYLVIRMNYVLHNYNEEKGTFSTLFSMHIFSAVIADVLKYESEHLAVYYHGVYTTDEEKEESAKAKVYYEGHNKFYECPQDSWTSEILDLFEDNNKLWEFLTERIPKRSIDILKWRYKDGKTCQEIGDLLGISKQRVVQINKVTLASIRKRIYILEPARALFL